MKNKKKLFGLLLSLTAIMTLCSCGTSQNNQVIENDSSVEGSSNESTNRIENDKIIVEKKYDKQEGEISSAEISNFHWEMRIVDLNIDDENLNISLGYGCGDIQDILENYTYNPDQYVNMKLKRIIYNRNSYGNLSPLNQEIIYSKNYTMNDFFTKNNFKYSCPKKFIDENNYYFDYVFNNDNFLYDVITPEIMTGFENGYGINYEIIIKPLNDGEVLFTHEKDYPINYGFARADCIYYNMENGKNTFSTITTIFDKDTKF